MEWLNKLEEVEARYRELSEQMADPSVISDQSRYQQLAKQTADMTAVVEKFHAWKKLKQDAESARSMLDEPDPEMVELARQELAQAEAQLTEISEEIKVLLLPKDPNERKGCHSRSPRRHGRRRSDSLRRRDLPNVHSVR